MSLSDWLLEKKIERQTRDPEVKLKFTRVSYLFWCIAIFVWGYLLTEDIMNGVSQVSDYVFYVLFIAMIPMFIMSFKHAFIRGIAKAWYLPIIYALGLYVCVVAAMFFYTIVNYLGFYVYPTEFIQFVLYWFAAAALGVIVGSVCRLFRRR